MSVAAQIELTGARWSSAVHCPRRAVYDYQDAPKAPPTEQQKRWWRRGHAVEDAIAGVIVAELRDEGRRPRRQEEIPWPGGTAHADIYIPSETLVIEIKSNGAAALTTSAAIQAAGNALHHPRAERAFVRSVDSNTFEERDYPIDITGLEPQIREIDEQVTHGITTGELPSRVCSHPYDTEAFFCPYSGADGVCFQGWTRPEPDVLLLDEEAVRLADATDLVTRLEREAKAAKAQRDHLRDELRPYLDPGVELETPSLAKLQRTEIPGRVTLSLSDMRKAGVTVPRKLEPFVSTGRHSERWVVRRRA